MREGVGCRVDELVVKGFPFRDKGGEQGRVLWVTCVGGLVIIIIEEIDDGGGVGCLKITGRGFT